MSFSEIALRRMREQAPSIQTVLLMDRVPVRARSGWLPSGARIAGPGCTSFVRIRTMLPGSIRLVRRFTWVVDDPSDIDLCIKLGVDGIITNRPASVLRRLGRETISQRILALLRLADGGRCGFQAGGGRGSLWNCACG